MKPKHFTCPMCGSRSKLAWKVHYCKVADNNSYIRKVVVITFGAAHLMKHRIRSF